MITSYLHVMQDGETIFQVTTDPLPEDIKSIADGRRIFRVFKNTFMEMNKDGMFETVNLGHIVNNKEEGVTWTTSRPGNEKPIDACTWYSFGMKGTKKSYQTSCGEWAHELKEGECTYCEKPIQVEDNSE